MTLYICQHATTTHCSLYLKYSKEYPILALVGPRQSGKSTLAKALFPSYKYLSLEKVRCYRMAKRSATECAEILDVCQKLQLLDGQEYVKGRELIVRIVSILVKMAQRKNESGKGGQRQRHGTTVSKEVYLQRSIRKALILNISSNLE